MYKIFINEVPILIREDKAPEHLQSSESHPVFFFTQRREIMKAMQQIELGGHLRSLTIYGDDAKAIRSHLFSEYKKVKAAGGFVINENKEVLMIYRHSMWDLPKGKVEINESTKKAAVREVMEETGIGNLQLIKKLMKTYHTYLLGNNKILKTTHWYLMSSTDKEFRPQLSEGIENVKWVNIVEMENKYKHTYNTIRDVVDAGIIAAYLL